jgi:hypothetical protein
LASAKKNEDGTCDIKDVEKGGYRDIVKKEGDAELGFVGDECREEDAAGDDEHAARDEAQGLSQEIYKNIGRLIEVSGREDAGDDRDEDEDELELLVHVGNARVYMCTL